MNTATLPSYTSRQCTYLIRSRTGIYSFRWNILSNGKHHQPKLSLRTRNYLEAIQLSSTLALTLQKLVNPSLDEVKAVYSEYKGQSAKQSTLISSIDIESCLSDLSPKSIVEYRGCWNSFVHSLKGDDVTVVSVRQEHIERWKDTQTCSQTTLKKKLRLLSSCFNRLEIEHDTKWFAITVKENPVRPKRAMTDSEVKKVLKATEKFKPKSVGYDVGSWKYYLPRIACLTGCRLNEIAQLYASDIHIGDKPYISINDNGLDKRLKNKASAREVPINDALMALLMPLLAHRKSCERLFGDLPYSVSNGYNSAPSKWFGSLCRTSLKLRDISFHSIRHYTITKLFNEGIKEELIGSLMGHSIGKLTTGKVYMSGYNYANKHDAISRLTLLD
ncbi:tyrosine-type recombinase/integrase [Vibrio mediterranei]|uniref:tyrosine-type recombinase/integrase n=1 Tax=Vibrio mediterranei TaxID=689 RepID=UPI00148D173F|nr:tyrosine-type recombinase/integrase [Vibrio mediterranei]NOH27871.1 tyrosine-type recombinase/integrase [Vibrio mediterranei]